MVVRVRTCPIRQHLALALIYDAAIGIDGAKGASCVHPGSKSRRKEPKALGATQQHIQVVMKVVMQATA